MLGLKVCSDYSRYPIEQRTIYLFHKKDPSFDGAFILNSPKGDSKNIKIQFLALKKFQIFKKSTLWDKRRITNSVILNRDNDLEHTPFSLVFRDHKGLFVGELTIKIKGNYHSLLFKGFSDFEILRKSIIDINNSPYIKRIHDIIDDFLKEGEK